MSCGVKELIIDGVKYYPIGAFGWCWSEVTTEGEQV